MDRRVRIQQLAAEHRVTRRGALLGVARSASYDRRGGPGPRPQEDARLSPEGEAVCIEKRRSCGRVRLTHELRARGHACGERRVGRLMRAQRLQARPRRRFRPQATDRRHDSPIAPNGLAQRAAPPARPNEVWGTDFTDIPTGEGWLCLAVVLDLDSRRVVGWACGPALTTALARAALLTAHGLVVSMSRTANRYDNAALESFDSTPRIECLHRHKLCDAGPGPGRDV